MHEQTDILLRSLLFIPGNRPSMLEKGMKVPADALVPDLEDSVPVGEKDNARKMVSGAIEKFAQNKVRVIPRINSLDSGFAEQDLEAIVSSDIWGITVGKTDKPEDILILDSMISKLESKANIQVGTIKLIPYVESAMALINAYLIGIASPRVVGLAFGAEDFTKDMSIERTDSGAEIEYPRYVVAVAARAANIMAFDTPNVNIRNDVNLEVDVKKAVSLGFSGKFAIHPSQIETINRFFIPSEDQIRHAERVVAAAEKAELEGKGATTLDSRMIDAPIVERAKKLLAKLSAE